MHIRLTNQLPRESGRHPFGWSKASKTVSPERAGHAQSLSRPLGEQKRGRLESRTGVEPLQPAHEVAKAIHQLPKTASGHGALAIQPGQRATRIVVAWRHPRPLDQGV